MADALVELLIKQYKMDPKEAEGYAHEIHGRQNIKRQGSETYKLDKEESDQLRDEDNLQTEAIDGVAKREIRNLHDMKRRLERFSALHERRSNGEKLDPENESWYQSVRAAHDDAIRARGRQSGDQARSDASLSANETNISSATRGAFGGAGKGVGNARPPLPTNTYKQPSQPEDYRGMSDIEVRPYNKGVERQNALRSERQSYQDNRGMSNVDVQSYHPPQPPLPTGPGHHEAWLSRINAERQAYQANHVNLPAMDMFDAQQPTQPMGQQQIADYMAQMTGGKR